MATRKPLPTRMMMNAATGHVFHLNSHLMKASETRPELFEVEQVGTDEDGNPIWKPIAQKNHRASVEALEDELNRLREQVAEAHQTKASPMPTPDANRVAEIRLAIAKLDPSNEEHFTKDGKPKADALEALLADTFPLGITMRERDAAWADYLGDK